jgi:tetratricopeptide (TPR) repeat protein
MGTYAGLRVAFGACLALLTVASSFAAAPDLQARRDAQHRINVSGRQRMLVQRIAKAACLAAWDTGNAQPLRELTEARALFKSSMKVLTGNSSEFALTPDRETLAVPGQAAQLARQYDAAVDEFAAAFPAKPYQEKLAEVYELSLPVLTALNDAVDYMEAQHKDGHLIRPGLAAALNASGRQRMLSQKMAKELCMIGSGYMPQDTRAHLMGTIALFISSHEGLKRDLVQMKLEQKELTALLAQFGLIERHWQELGKLYIRVSTGGAPSSQDVQAAATESNSFLSELDRAVQLYESIDVSGSLSH